VESQGEEGGSGSEERATRRWGDNKRPMTGKRQRAVMVLELTRAEVRCRLGFRARQRWTPLGYPLDRLTDLSAELPGRVKTSLAIGSVLERL
jgi:hypothetical protein